MKNLFFQSQFHQTIQEVWKWYTRGRRRLGKEAGGSHAGDGVGFQDINVIAADDGVGAAVAPAAQGADGL